MQSLLRQWRTLVFAAAVCGVCGLSGYVARGGQTQVEMNMQAGRAYQNADAALNSAYRKLMQSLESSKQARLKAAQKAWLTFRDAETAFRASQMEGGSAYPTLYSSVATDLTEQRTKELRDAYKQFHSR